MDINEYVNSVRWKFAKTMPFMPHWYTLDTKTESFQNTVEQKAGFKELVRLIFEEGYDVKLKNGKVYRYYDIGEFKYWSMDPTQESTDLINRAYIRKYVTDAEKKDFLPVTPKPQGGLDWT